MSFIPHSPADVQSMFDVIGIKNINQLFEEIPDEFQVKKLNLPEGLSELAVTRLIKERLAVDKPLLNFAGGGAYEHHIPSAVWQIVTRGEFYTAYTPYQAEASQGTLQVIYEFQSFICELLAMDCANASMYDGASAVAEAVLMALRIPTNSKKPRAVLVPRTLSPRIREVLRSILPLQDINIIEIDYDRKTGKTLINEIEKNPACCLIIPQPNYFGVLEDVDELTDCANKNNLTTIGYVNPLAMTLLKPPGKWGSHNQGVEIAVGEGQPLGLPLSSGGPYLGLMTCKQDIVRNMPGRIIGKTLDKKGRECFVLTLQAREQHIRRGKATSNICSNQGLMVCAATISMAIMGETGIYNQAVNSHDNLETLKQLIATNCKDKLSPTFNSPVFHEQVFSIKDIKAEELINKGLSENILVGISVTEEYPELGESVLICTTETKTLADLQKLNQLITQI